MQSSNPSVISNSDAQTHYAIATLFRTLIKTRNLKLGRALHSQLIKAALNFNTFFTNRLIDLYSKCHSLECAQRVFNELPFKNSRSWNTLVSGYSHVGRIRDAHQLLVEMPHPDHVSYNTVISSLNQSGLHKESINVFRSMQKLALVMDEYTFVGLVNACASLNALQLLCQMHSMAIVIGLDMNVVVCNALIDGYGKCRKPEYSYFVFDQMGERDVVSWTSMVVAYARASRLDEAFQIFNQMPVKNAISWTSLIATFAQNGMGERALSLFVEMENEGIIPNAFTFVSVISGCADLALVEKGKQIHCRIIRIGSGLDSDNVFVANALIDMYCKCGDMMSAMTLFERLRGKDTVTWNSMITGVAQNGDGNASLGIFKKMIQANVQPNYVTFLGVLSACSHSGLESEGLQILDMMEKEFHLIPESEHYAILVDLLGRQNRLEEAFGVIQKAPRGSDHIGMWGSLLSACRVHGNMELAQTAAEALFELEPENTGRYVMLYNIYVAAGQWDLARQVRSAMEDQELKKEAGCSWVEVNNVRHKFVAEDDSHSQIEEIQEFLHLLANQMKDIGCITPLKFHFASQRECVDRWLSS